MPNSPQFTAKARSSLLDTIEKGKQEGCEELKKLIRDKLSDFFKRAMIKPEGQLIENLPDYEINELKIPADSTHFHIIRTNKWRLIAFFTYNFEVAPYTMTILYIGVTRLK